MSTKIDENSSNKNFFKSFPYSLILALASLSLAIFGIVSLVLTREVTTTTSIVFLGSLIGALMFWGSLTDYPS